MFDKKNGLMYDVIYELVMQEPRITVNDVIVMVDQVFGEAKTQALDDREEIALRKAIEEEERQKEYEEYYQLRMGLDEF